MSSALLRQLAMLKNIPRYRKKITTRQLRERLQAEGFDIHQRTIQRDLKNLARIFPDLQTDGSKDIAGWYWKNQSAIHDFPSIDSATALTFKMTETFLKNQIPSTVLQLLEPYFQRSNEVLGAIDNPGFANWADKVRMVPRTMPLVPALIGQEIIDGIYTAILEEKQFRGRYQRRNRDEAEYIFHPLGLVFRESVVYLVATVWEYDDPRHYALHRFTSCEILPEASNRPADFNLDEYLKSGSFEYGDDGNIRLTARFYHGAGAHLKETPLSEDQKITEQDGTLQITASVNNSLQLRWWLLGFGDNVEVIKPKSLRNEFIEIIDSLHKRYI